MPAVSVIIPFYKGEQFIAQTLDSVVAQSFSDFEVICVDDHSPDKTAEIVQKYAKKDPRIIYLKHEHNMGAPAFGRNTGLGIARGKWVAFLDHDDLWEPTKLAEQLQFMEEERVAFSCTNIYLLNNLTGKKEGTAWGRVEGLGKKGFAERLLQGNFVPPASTLMKREVFAKVGTFDTALKGADDYDMWYRIVREFPAAVLNKPLASWRYLNEASISSDDTFMIKDELAFYQKVLDYGKEAEKVAAEAGITRDKKLLANRRLLHGHTQEARQLYEEAGTAWILPYLRVAPWGVRAAYGLKRKLKKNQFQPLDLSFPT